MFPLQWWHFYIPYSKANVAINRSVLSIRFSFLPWWCTSFLYLPLFYTTLWLNFPRHSYMGWCYGQSQCHPNKFRYHLSKNIQVAVYIFLQNDNLLPICSGDTVTLYYIDKTRIYAYYVSCCPIEASTNQFRLILEIYR